MNVCAGQNVPPPDPAVFNELAEVVREMLTESLQRFVLATYNNVGTPRAVCGSAGGIVIGLAGRCVHSSHYTLPPMDTTLLYPHISSPAEAIAAP